MAKTMKAANDNGAPATTRARPWAGLSKRRQRTVLAEPYDHIAILIAKAATHGVVITKDMVDLSWEHVPSGECDCSWGMSDERRAEVAIRVYAAMVLSSRGLPLPPSLE